MTMTMCGRTADKKDINENNYNLKYIRSLYNVVIAANYYDP